MAVACVRTSLFPLILNAFAPAARNLRSGPLRDPDDGAADDDKIDVGTARAKSARAKEEISVLFFNGSRIGPYRQRSVQARPPVRGWRMSRSLARVV